MTGNDSTLIFSSKRESLLENFSFIHKVIVTNKPLFYNLKSVNLDMFLFSPNHEAPSTSKFICGKAMPE